LLVERAHSADPHFALTAKNAGAVARLSRLLEGIPLAIELAAARVRTMPVEEICVLMEDRLQVLARSRPDGGRHRTRLELRPSRFLS
jgi:predicted ATPase